MAVFKIEKCPECRYKHTEPKPGKVNKKCPVCGTRMYYLDNWYISYQVQKQKKVEVGGLKKRTAKDKLSKIKISLQERRFFDPAPRTPWGVAVKKFKAIHYKQGSRGKGPLSPDTVRMYNNSLNILKPFFQSTSLDLVTYDQVKLMICARQAKGLTPSTINKEIVTLKCLLNFAELHDLLEMNNNYRKIVKHIKPMDENNRRDRILTDDEEISIIGYPNKDLRLQCLISLETGLRKEGCMSLTWPEVDFTAGYIRKVVGIKGGKPTNIPLTQRLTAELLARKGAQVLITPYVFYNRSACKPFIDNKTAFNKMCGPQKLGLEDLHFHDLRRTFATRFIRRTGKWEALRKILGHQDIKTTMRYVHLDDKDVAQAMGEFENNKKEGTG